MNRNYQSGEKLLFWISATALLGAVFALVVLDELWIEYRSITLLASSFIILISLFLIVGLDFHHRTKAKQLWRQLMAACEDHPKNNKIPSYRFAHLLSEGALKHLAIQVYQKIGYVLIENAEDDQAEFLIKLLNPMGEIEMVLCTQASEPLGLGYISNMLIIMNLNKAVRGFIWAPGGFASNAIHYAKGKPIVLADNLGIGRLVDGSNLSR